MSQLTDESFVRYEKEFDSVQDVFELQVAFPMPSVTTIEAENLTVHPLTAQPEQRIRLRPGSISIRHHSSSQSCKESQRLPHSCPDFRRYNAVIISQCTMI